MKPRPATQISESLQALARQWRAGAVISAAEGAAFYTTALQLIDVLTTIDRQQTKHARQLAKLNRELADTQRVQAATDTVLAEWRQCWGDQVERVFAVQSRRN